MTTVNPLATGNRTDTVAPKPADMAKDEFLTMLITQLKHQDPLNPMDGTEFTAQLAQFSSLEQLANLNTQMEAMNKRQAAMDNISSVGLIGKSVLGEGNSIVADGGKVDISYLLKDDIAEGLLEIYQSDGTVVDTIEIGRRGPGEHSHSWDSSGVAEGTYEFRLTAENDTGGYAAWTPRTMGEVTGVSFKDDGVYLSVNGDEIALSTVSVISRGTESE